MDKGQKPKALIYARVSTNRQSETGHSLESQSQRLVLEAEAQGYETEVIFEVGSGKRDTRPKLLAALVELKSGKAQALFCLDLDRLARSPQNALDIAQNAKKQNWRLVIVSLGADTATPAGQLVFGIMAMVAQMESALTSERVLRQHEARRERGITWGVDQGFKGQLSPKIRKKVLSLREEDKLSFREIAEELTEQGFKTIHGGLWYPQTIKQILESPQTARLRKVA